MGRRAEPGIGYYPRNVDMVQHKKIKLLFQEFDSHGPWIFDCLLSEIYSDKGYFLDISDKDSIALFASDVCKKPVSLVNQVIIGCVRRKLFDQRVFDLFKILTSDRIQNNYVDATSERRRKGTKIEIRGDILLIPFDEGWQNVVLLGNKANVPRKNEVNPVINPQSKVEERKVEERKVEGESRAREDFFEFFKIKMPELVPLYDADIRSLENKAVEKFNQQKSFLKPDDDEGLKKLKSEFETEKFRLARKRGDIVGSWADAFVRHYTTTDWRDKNGNLITHKESAAEKWIIREWKYSQKDKKKSA